MYWTMYKCRIQYVVGQPFSYYSDTSGGSPSYKMGFLYITRALPEEARVIKCAFFYIFLRSTQKAKNVIVSVRNVCFRVSIG